MCGEVRLQHRGARTVRGYAPNFARRLACSAAHRRIACSG
jgi:hypothetical protein